MGQTTAGELPLGQKNDKGHVVVSKDDVGDGRVIIKYYVSGEGYYKKEFGVDDKVANHCCGSCKAAGTYSKNKIDPNDSMTKEAARLTKEHKGHGI